MRVVEMRDYGGPEVLRLREVDDPVAGPGEVLVDVHAASVNPADWKTREGTGRVLPEALPHVLGRDFSGIVREVGEGVSDLAAGDAVFGVAVQGKDGCYAEALAIDAAIVARKPPSVSHAEAAALALGGLTSLVALEDTAQLQPLERILVHGGAGGVGHFAVQFAKHVGAEVISTARGSNLDYLRSLGADETVDYTQEDFAEVVADCDVVFDTVGGEVHARSLSVLKPGGRLIYVAPPPEGFEPDRDDVAVIRPQVGRDRRHLDRVMELVTSGAVRPPEITTMPLAEAGEAQERKRQGQIRGKAVLEVR